jgi:putative hydrolase of the HAD superfamily
MIKAVIFDYGGVIKVAHPIPLTIASIFKATEYEIMEQKKITAPFYSLLQRGLINENDFWKKVANALGKPLPKEVKRLARISYSESFTFYPDILRLVKELRARKIKTAVLSNIAKLQADVIRKNKGYKGFNVVVLSYKEKLEKPELDIYLSTIKKLKLKPEECIFIDDKEKNLVPAKNLGMHTVHAINSTQIIKDVNSIIESQNEKSI